MVDSRQPQLVDTEAAPSFDGRSCQLQVTTFLFGAMQRVGWLSVFLSSLDRRYHEQVRAHFIAAN
jgi:hypothetical protein